MWAFMPYKRGSVYWCRVALPRGAHVERSAETGNKAVAAAIESTLSDIHAQRRWDLLDAVRDRRITIGELYDARHALDTVSARLADIDLLPLVDEWHAELISRKLRSANKYRMQLLTVVGPAPMRSMFTRAILSQSLSTVVVSTSTRNRYRAAVSAFGSWMVERNFLPHNPVRDIRGYPNAPPRDVWLTRPQAQQLVAALPPQIQALEALMAGTGMEWQACHRVRRCDIDVAARTVYANGGKTPWRQRTVRVTEDWAWAYVVAHARSYTGSARLFPLDHSSCRYHHWRTFVHPAFTGWPRHSMRDFRHTYAVNALLDGMPPQLVAHQLGHKDTTLLMRVYGRFIPADAEYARYYVARQGASK
jgi:integrase